MLIERLRSWHVAQPLYGLGPRVRLRLGGIYEALR